MKPNESTQLIWDDHKKIRGLLTQCQASQARVPSMTEGVLRELLMELEIHSALEEEIFYPAIEAAADVTGKTLVAEHGSDHERLRKLIEGIRKEPVGGIRDDLLAQLTGELELHLHKEEKDLLPLASELLANGPELALRMLARREELYRQPQYASAHPKRVQDPSGGEQKRKDAGPQRVA